MTTPERDRHWMRRALRIASHGFTPPNPMVGCVIVNDNVVVGEGFHLMAGMPHAEVNALRLAGARARGATVYVTLEPHCYQGRTPPCTDALIAAGIRRVVVAQLDPNSQVNGRGVEQLEKQGIQVEVGLMAGEAGKLNAAFLHFQNNHTPYTTIKAAVTMDGKTAANGGASHWISGQESRRHVHNLRARSGAVMVGIGTVLADDPQLTARLSPDPPRQPLRIIVDSRLRTPQKCRAIQVSSARTPLLIVTTDQGIRGADELFKGDGIEILRLPSCNGKVDLRAMMAALTERQVISVLVEGGGELNAALLCAGLIHKVLFFIAPVLFGGRSSPTAIGGDGVRAVSDAVRLKDVTVRRFGPDYAFEGSIAELVNSD